MSVEIANPLAGNRPYLRRSILPTLAGTVQLNLRRGLDNISLYELGHVYLWDPNAPAIPALPGGVRPTDEQLAALDAGLPDQPMHVAGILTGLAENSGWLGGCRYGYAATCGGPAAPWTGATPSRPSAALPIVSAPS